MQMPYAGTWRGHSTKARRVPAIVRIFYYRKLTVVVTKNRDSPCRGYGYQIFADSAPAKGVLNLLEKRKMRITFLVSRKEKYRLSDAVHLAKRHSDSVLEPITKYRRAAQCDRDDFRNL